MKRLLWTCAAGVLPLTLACDPQPDGGDVADHELRDAPQLEDAELRAPAAPRRPIAGVPLDPSLVKAVQRRDRPADGATDGQVEIMIYSDFECPYCRKAVGILEDVITAYPDEVRVVFKQMPLPMHPNAEVAARASLAAQRQGKFWPMHDAMFEQPRRVRAGDFSEIAAELGLDIDRFEEDLEDPELAAMVERDVKDAGSLGIRGTPTMVIGNTLVVGAQPVDTLRTVIDAELDR